MTTLQYIDRAVPVLGTLITSVVFLIQDNAAGRLDSWEGVLWSLLKCLIVWLFFGTVVVLRWFGRKLSDYIRYRIDKTGL